MHPAPQACIYDCVLHRCGNTTKYPCIAHWHCHRCELTRCHDQVWRPIRRPGSTLPRVQAEGTAA